VREQEQTLDFKDTRVIRRIFINPMSSSKDAINFLKKNLDSRIESKIEKVTGSPALVYQQNIGTKNILEFRVGRINVIFNLSKSHSSQNPRAKFDSITKVFPQISKWEKYVDDIFWNAHLQVNEEETVAMNTSSLEQIAESILLTEGISATDLNALDRLLTRHDHALIFGSHIKWRNPVLRGDWKVHFTSAEGKLYVIRVKGAELNIDRVHPSTGKILDGLFSMRNKPIPQLVNDREFLTYIGSVDE
jgi:hypothetical protein